MSYFMSLNPFPVQGNAGIDSTGNDLGSHGTGSVYYLPPAGFRRSDCGWFHCNRCCGIRYADSCGSFSYSYAAHCFPGRSIGRYGNGTVEHRTGNPGILASILTQISLYSINLNIMGKANQPVSVDNYPLVVSLRYVTDGSVSRLLFFLGMIVFLLALIAVMYWYFGTEQGHAIRATGCNSNMARAQGINTNFIKVLALMISNGLVGLCGALYGQFQGASDVNMGRGAIVIGLAAVIIGEVLFR